MAPNRPTPTFLAQVRVLQIIVLAMVLGVIAAGVTLAVMRQQGPPQDILAPWVSYGFMGFGLLTTVLGVVFPPFLAAAQLRQRAGDQEGGEIATWAERWMPIYQTKTIISGALFEGGAFLNIIGFYLSGRWPHLIVAAIGLVGVLALIPTANRVVGWAEKRQREVRDELMLRGLR